MEQEHFVYNEDMGKILLNTFLEQHEDLLNLIEDLEHKIECFPKLQVLILQPPELVVETETVCDESSQKSNDDSMAIIDPIAIKHEVIENEEEPCQFNSESGFSESIKEEPFFEDYVEGIEGTQEKGYIENHLGDDMAEDWEMGEISSSTSNKISEEVKLKRAKSRAKVVPKILVGNLTEEELTLFMKKNTNRTVEGLIKCKLCKDCYDGEIKDHFLSKHKEHVCYKCHRCSALFKVRKHLFKHQWKNCKGLVGMESEESKSEDECKEEEDDNTPAEEKLGLSINGSFLDRTDTITFVEENMFRDGENGRNWTCKVCGYNARGKGTVSNHVEAVHCGLASWICDDCGRLFKTKKSLRIHSKKFNGECTLKDPISNDNEEGGNKQLETSIPFGDNVRERKLPEFKSMEARNKYNEITRAMRGPILTREEFESWCEENMMRNQDGKWMCQVCQKSAVNKNDIRRHMESGHHVNVEPSMCDNCGMFTKTSTGMRCHQLNHPECRPY